MVIDLDGLRVELDSLLVVALHEFFIAQVLIISTLVSLKVREDDDVP